MAVAARTKTRVVYETVDLVPEYRYLGDEHRSRSLQEERRLIGRVDGFITACDWYADYYVERHGDVLRRPPVVRDNMPRLLAEGVRATTRPLRMVFLGTLMFDRPVKELLQAMALSSADSTLTLQGKNLLGEAPAALISELGLQDRVEVVGPCPPSAIVETAASYDIGVVALWGRDENERRAATSKIFTYMAAGLAVFGIRSPRDRADRQAALERRPRRRHATGGVGDGDG